MGQVEICSVELKLLGAFLLICVNDSDNVWGGWCCVFVVFVNIF